MIDIDRSVRIKYNVTKIYAHNFRSYTILQYGIILGVNSDIRLYNSIVMSLNMQPMELKIIFIYFYERAGIKICFYFRYINKSP